MRTSSRLSGWALSGAFFYLVALSGPMAAQSDPALENATPSQTTEVPTLSCPADMVLGTGPADPEILSAEASVGVRAFWCERYDAFGRAKRVGPYREVYSNGQIRLEATYVKVGDQMRLEGPVEIRNDDGTPFLKGFLKQGEWDGAFEIFYDKGLPTAATPPPPADSENPLGPTAAKPRSDAGQMRPAAEPATDLIPANPTEELSAAN